MTEPSNGSAKRKRTSGSTTTIRLKAYGLAPLSGYPGAAEPDFYEASLAIAFFRAASLAESDVPSRYVTGVSYLPFITVLEFSLAKSKRGRRVFGADTKKNRCWIYGRWEFEAVIAIEHASAVYEQTICQLIELAAFGIGLGFTKGGSAMKYGYGTFLPYEIEIIDGPDLPKDPERGLRLEDFPDR